MTRWPQKTVEIRNGAYILTLLIFLYLIFPIPAIAGLEVLWLIWWMATWLADLIDKRRVS